MSAPVLYCAQMKSVTKPAGEKPNQNVLVQVGDRRSCKQPGEFRLCPLGLQFYSEKPLREFDLLEFNLADPGKQNGKKSAKTIKCTGAVVRCQADKKDNLRYKVWIQFLDLPKKTREKLNCVSHDGKHLCDYCENF